MSSLNQFQALFQPLSSIVCDESLYLNVQEPHNKNVFVYYL